MEQDRKRSGQSSGEPAEGRDDVPAPEQGSPREGDDAVREEDRKRVEKGENKDPNPLAPPVNTQAGS